MSGEVRAGWLEMVEADIRAALEDKRLAEEYGELDAARECEETMNRLLDRWLAGR